MADRIAQYEPLIQAAAAKYGVSPDELRAIMRTESNGNPRAVSKKGAVGLMQINLHAHPMDDPFNPEKNILKGAEVLRASYDFMRRNGVPDDQLQDAAWAGYDRSPAKVLANIKNGISPDIGTDNNGTYAATVRRNMQIPSKPQPTNDAAQAPVATAKDNSADGFDATPLPSGKFVFQNRVGQYKLVDADDASNAYYNQHLRPVDPDKYVAEETEKALRLKYGNGLGNALKALGEGAFNGLFGDAGDAFLAETGIEPKDAIKAHAKYFGGLRKTAAAGTLLGSFLTGEGEARAGIGAAATGAKALEAGEAARGLLPAAEVAAEKGTAEVAGQAALEGGHPAFRQLQAAPKGQQELNLGKLDDVQPPYREPHQDELPRQEQLDLPLEGGSAQKQLHLPLEQKPLPSPKQAREGGKFVKSEWNLGKMPNPETQGELDLKTPGQQELPLGDERRTPLPKSDADSAKEALDALGGDQGQMPLPLQDRVPGNQFELPLAEREAPPTEIADADIISSKAQPPPFNPAPEPAPRSLLTGRGPSPLDNMAAANAPRVIRPRQLRQSYEQLVKDYGKERADFIVSASPDNEQSILANAPNEETTKANIGKKQYNAEGVMGESKFGLPGSNDNTTGYIPPDGHPAFKFTANRPTNAPLPNERTVGIPEAPEPVTEPARFTVDESGNVSERRGAMPGAAPIEPEVLPPEPNGLPPEPGAEPTDHPAFRVDENGNVFTPASQQTIETTAVPTPEPAPGAAPGAATGAMPGAVPVQPVPTFGELAQRAAKLSITPNKAIFGVGKQIGTAVERATGSKILGAFARGAAESVPFTIGGNLSEATLNDEKITPERLFAGGLGNALIAGGLGGAFGLAEKGLNKLNLHFADTLSRIPVVQRVKNMAQSFNDVRAGTQMFSKAVYEDGLKYARVGQILGDTDTAVKGGGSAAWKELNSSTEQFIQSLKEAKSPIAKKVVQAHDDFYVASRNAQNDAQLFQAADKFKNRIQEIYHEDLSQAGKESDFGQQLNHVKQAWRAGLEDSGTFGKAADFQRELNAAWKQLIDKNARRSPIFAAFMRKGLLDGEGEMVFDEAKLHSFLKSMASSHPEHQATAELKSQIMKEWLDAHRDYIGVLRKSIYEPLGREADVANFHDTLGASDGKIAKTIQDMQDLSDSQKKSMWQKLLSSHTMRYGAAMGMMAAGVPHAFMLSWGVSTVLNHMLGAGLAESGFARALTEHGERFDATLQEAIKAAFEGGKTLSGAVGIFRQLNLTPKPLESTDRHEQVAELAENLAAAVNDPHTAERIAAGTGMLNVAHPELAVAVQAHALTALNYLHDQSPKDPLPPSPFNTVPFRPGHAEVARFENVAEVVMNPLAIVRDFGNGSLSTEQVQAAETIYPELTAHIRQLASAELANHANKMDYQQKLAFGRLMGAPMDWSAQPDAIQALQQLYKLPSPGQGDPSKGGNANVKKSPRAPNSFKQATMLSDMVQTNMQSALAHV